MATGEFAQLSCYLKGAENTSLTARGLLFHDTELYAMHLDSAVQQRDRASLRQYAPRAEETAWDDQHLLHQAAAHRGWGVLHRLEGEYAAAETRLRQALEMFEGLDTQWQVGRTFFELGELAQAQTDTTSARNYFNRALASFEEMNAAPDVARTQAALNSLD